MCRSLKFPSAIPCAILLTLPVAAMAADPTVWTTNYSASNYSSYGAITFNDWGYTGPNGANAGTFAVTSPVTGVTGFDSTRIGQVQNVLTHNPDWATPDPTTAGLPKAGNARPTPKGSSRGC